MEDRRTEKFARHKYVFFRWSYILWGFILAIVISHYLQQEAGISLAQLVFAATGDFMGYVLGVPALASIILPLIFNYFIHNRRATDK